MNREMLIPAAKLGLIAMLTALVLGIVNALTAPAIERNRLVELRAALSTVSGGAVIGEESEGDSPVVSSQYPLTFRDGSSGLILSLSAVGYGGDMAVLAGFRDTGEVVGAVLMENSETPGLGKAAEAPEYMQRFIGTGAERNPVPTGKSDLAPSDADAISGATITFSGIAVALAEGAAYVRGWKESQDGE
jgi:Na+-translocating ferredoxin:NAD+ oxidoreductase subunit G